jgi:hypothetical protein
VEDGLGEGLKGEGKVYLEDESNWAARNDRES